MPADTFYGSECELRVGLMADRDTDPTDWFTLEFISATFQPQRDRKERPKMGAPRNNALDPIKPVEGFFRLSGDIVVDADSRQTPRWLRCLLGAPTTGAAVGGIYPHTWTSGARTAQLCCIQIRTGAAEVRVYRGVTLAALSLAAAGEQVQDFDLQLSVKGLTRERVADWLDGTLNAVPASAPINRAVFRIDGVAASNTLSAQWNYDRGLAEDLFLSPTATVAELRPGPSSMTGQAQFRAVGGPIDTLEENSTVFSPDIQGLGSIANHEIRLTHLQALLNAPPLAIPGPGLIERTFTWSAFQTAAAPGVQIRVANDVASYAA